MLKRPRIALLIFLSMLLTAPVGAAQLFPLQTGIVLEYNSSDNLNHSWHMKMQILEQVTFDNQTYFHLRQTKYDPFSGDPNNQVTDMYIRSTDKEVYRFNGFGEDIVFRVADIGTRWNFPVSGGNVFTEIIDISDITIPYGGPYQAYVHRSYFASTGGSPSPTWDDYIVPGLTNVKTVDNWLDNSARVPLTHALARITRGGPAPAVGLLLTD